MKRTISLWLGLLAFAFLPVLAQAPAPSKGNGKIHGHITNPTGAPQKGGAVMALKVGVAIGPGMSPKITDGGTFPVDDNGDYSGEIPPGNYDITYRAPNTPTGMVTDKFEAVKVFAGQDLLQDFDMTRKEYLDAMPAEERKQLEEVKKKNAAIIQANLVIRNLNADLKTATQDFKDADNAHDAAVAALGASASKSEVDAKETEIKVAKYGEVESMMLKDSAAKADASVIWAQLGQAQLGLARAQKDRKKYDEAEVAFKKVLEIEAASKKPSPSTQGAAQAGLGEVYARTGKVPEANAAFDEAAKVNPTQTGFYLKNEMVIFFQEQNADAQVAAAEEVIKSDPTNALAYYLKGSGLVGKATVDPKTNKLVAPPGCEDAYKKYLELAPTGQYAGDVKSILATLNTALPPAAPPAKASKKK